MLSEAADVERRSGRVRTISIRRWRQDAGHASSTSKGECTRPAGVCGKINKHLLCAALFLASSVGEVSPLDRLVSAQLVAVPEMPRPDYLQPVTDPVFGTSLTRITDPGRQLATGISCRQAYCRHRYSSTQAWNSDQSLLVIANGCYGLCFLDGRTYKPLFHRSIGDEDCKWHPTRSAVMICVSPTEIYSWAPQANVKATIYAPRDYSNLQFGPSKGNTSNDGNRLVVLATNRAGAPVAFAYDVAAKRKHADIELASLPGRIRSCGISASGRFVACFHETHDGIEDAYVFTIEGARLQHWTEHHRPGHGDMALDEDGSDIYVGISKADPDKWHVIKRRLEDGFVISLAASGYGVHASVRNINQPGWVFLSYEGAYDKVAGSRGRLPFYQEVVALRLDGSGEIRRIAQTRNIRQDYYSETHASPSPDGSQVVWSSNWGEPGGPVAAYVSRLTWPRSLSSNRSN